MFYNSWPTTKRYRADNDEDRNDSKRHLLRVERLGGLQHGQLTVGTQQMFSGGGNGALHLEKAFINGGHFNGNADAREDTSVRDERLLHCRTFIDGVFGHLHLGNNHDGHDGTQ